MKDKEIIMCLTGFKQKKAKKTCSSFSGELSARLIVRIIKEKRISWNNMHKFETAIVFNHSFGRLKANCLLDVNQFALSYFENRSSKTL